jgi:nucleotide-binding universal stress UspA family protein
MFCRPLLLLDHGPAGQQALRAAIALAQGLRSRLTIVHAIDERGAWIALGGGQVYAEHPQLRRHGEQLLAGARDQLPADLPCCTQLVHGPRKSGRQVLDIVTAGNHDLLVAGCECRPAPGWHAFGCDAHWLVHHAPVPVMTVGDEVAVPTPPLDALEPGRAAGGGEREG